MVTSGLRVSGLLRLDLGCQLSTSAVAVLPYLIPENENQGEEITHFLGIIGRFSKS